MNMELFTSALRERLCREGYSHVQIMRVQALLIPGKGRKGFMMLKPLRSNEANALSHKWIEPLYGYEAEELIRYGGEGSVYVVYDEVAV